MNRRTILKSIPLFLGSSAVANTIDYRSIGERVKEYVIQEAFKTELEVVADLFCYTSENLSSYVEDLRVILKNELINKLFYSPFREIEITTREERINAAALISYLSKESKKVLVADYFEENNIFYGSVVNFSWNFGFGWGGYRNEKIPDNHDSDYIFLLKTKKRTPHDDLAPQVSLDNLKGNIKTFISTF